MLAIETKNLGRQFGQHHALQGFNVQVRPGEVVGLFGANGAGKTTSLRLLAGLLTPTTGQVALFGSRPASVMAKVGVVLEEPSFYPNLSSLENLSYALTCAGQRTTRTQQQEILDLVGLHNAKGRVAGFSLGMRKRLALGIALGKNPDLLLLDEPTNGLDIDGVELLRDLIRQRAAKGTACVFSTHEWDEAQRLVDRVVILHEGRIICDRALPELVRPQDQWVVRCANPAVTTVLEQLPGVSILESDLVSGEYTVLLQGVPPTLLTEGLVAATCTPESITPKRQSLGSVYRSLVKARDVK